MSTFTINTINGVPPYDIYVCNTFLLNCILVSSGVTSTPVTFETPSAYTYSPSIIIKIIDSQNCEHIQTYSCISQTPTPSLTVTPSYTPSNTPTPNVTPSNTQTPYTPTPTTTSTLTSTPTPTPTKTPAILSGFSIAFLFIEPITASTILGEYMQSQGSNFFGFSNGVAPSTNQVDFENEMNLYMNYSGWTSGELPEIVSMEYPSTPYPTGSDYYGNKLSSYNFETIFISALTSNVEAWYTFFITTAYTNSLYQKSIDFSLDSPNTFSQANTNSTYYKIDFTFKTGYKYYEGTRLYTTYPSTEFLLDNSQNLYFKGSVIGT
jgi:hypothetical protein